MVSAEEAECGKDPSCIVACVRKATAGRAADLAGTMDSSAQGMVGIGYLEFLFRIAKDGRGTQLLEGDRVLVEAAIGAGVGKVKRISGFVVAVLDTHDCDTHWCAVNNETDNPAILFWREGDGEPAKAAQFGEGMDLQRTAEGFRAIRYATDNRDGMVQTWTPAEGLSEPRPIPRKPGRRKAR